FRGFESLLASFELSKAYDLVWVAIAEVDGYLELTAPWKLRKHQESVHELATVLWVSAEALRLICIYILPLIPNAAKEALARIGVTDVQCVHFATATQWGITKTINGITKQAALFPRIAKSS